MKGIRTAGKILSVILAVILAGILACNLYTVAARNFGGIEYPTIFGYYRAIVVSGSMSGSIEINDMVVVHREDHYEVGDVVSYKTESNLVTHRIVDRTEDGFITKGDANNVEDREPVSPEQILGKVVLVVPGVGRFFEFTRTPLGMCAAAAVILVVVFLPCGQNRKKEENKES